MSHAERVQDYLEHIAEAIERAIRYLASHPEIPWKPMRDIRNKVIHDYFDVAWDIVWDTIKRDFPPLLKTIKSLTSSEAKPASNKP